MGAASLHLATRVEWGGGGTGTYKCDFPWCQVLNEQQVHIVFVTVYRKVCKVKLVGVGEITLPRFVMLTRSKGRNAG